MSNPQFATPRISPCPFCGGDGSLGTTTISRWKDMSGNYGSFTGHSVNCIVCGATTRGIAEGSKTPELAIEIWNRRSTPSAKTLTALCFNGGTCTQEPPCPQVDACAKSPRVALAPTFDKLMEAKASGYDDGVAYTIERCAKVCHDYAMREQLYTEAGTVCHRLADAIRALNTRSDHG